MAQLQDSNPRRTSVVKSEHLIAWAITAGSGNGSAQDGVSLSKEPSAVVMSKLPRRRVILSARPAKKPNFMHLLTLNVDAEVNEEIPISPPRSPTPELDFDIEHESPVETPSPPSTVRSQPLPPIRYATTPSPVPQHIVIKSPTPEPKQEPPEPIVIRQRPRKSLDTFLHSRRGPPLPKRPEVIQPLTKKELKEIVDPLDYLSKYCLIRLDRLPYYEKVFREVVSYQIPRFQQSTEATATVQDAVKRSAAQQPAEAAAALPRDAVQQPAPSGKLPLSSANAEKLPLSSTEAITSSAGKTPVARPPLNYRRLLRSFAQLMSVPEFDEPAINVGEFHVQRITFAMQKQYERYDKLVQTAEFLEAHRDRAIADLAKEKYSDVLHPPAASSEKNAGAKRANGRTEKAGRSRAEATKPRKLSDSEVLQRLPSPLMDELLENAAVRTMTIKLNRLEERIAAAEQRMTELEEEKQEMERWAQEVYEAERSPPDSLGAVTSDDTNILGYLRPSEDGEMNLEELEYALRLVNNQLITQRELAYVYHILKIPGRRRINLKTFCCVSALSEKVQELDPVVRTLVNAFDYDALEIKMEVCKELFYMLADKSADVIDGAISIRTLAAEFVAGGISRENLNYVIRKLDFRRKGYVEYLDFLVYIPLFVEIHRRIVLNPLSDHRASYESSSQPLNTPQQQPLD